MFNEKWDTKMKTPESKKGMFSGKNLAELRKERAALKEKEKRTSAGSTKLKEVNFAIRAKQRNKWGKVK
jgi:hypothetical protein